MLLEHVKRREEVCSRQQPVAAGRSVQQQQQQQIQMSNSAGAGVEDGHVCNGCGKTAGGDWDATDNNFYCVSCWDEFEIHISADPVAQIAQHMPKAALKNASPSERTAPKLGALESVRPVATAMAPREPPSIAAAQPVGVDAVAVEMLVTMGFAKSSIMEQLLRKYNNNVENVLNELLSLPEQEPLQSEEVAAGGGSCEAAVEHAKEPRSAPAPAHAQSDAASESSKEDKTLARAAFLLPPGAAANAAAATLAAIVVPVSASHIIGGLKLEAKEFVPGQIFGERPTPDTAEAASAACREEAGASGSAYDECCMCMEGGAPDTTLLPCEHTCVCTNCAKICLKLKLCPICRQPITRLELRGYREGAGVESDDDGEHADDLPTFARATDYLKYNTLKSKQKKRLLRRYFIRPWKEEVLDKKEVLKSAVHAAAGSLDKAKSNLVSGDFAGTHQRIASARASFDLAWPCIPHHYLEEDTFSQEDVEKCLQRKVLCSHASRKTLSTLLQHANDEMETCRAKISWSGARKNSQESKDLAAEMAAHERENQKLRKRFEIAENYVATLESLGTRWLELPTLHATAESAHSTVAAGMQNSAEAILSLKRGDFEQARIGRTLASRCFLDAGLSQTRRLELLGGDSLGSLILADTDAMHALAVNHSQKSALYSLYMVNRFAS